MKGWFDDATMKANHQVQCRLVLDVVVQQGVASSSCLPVNNQPLLVRWDDFLILDLSLDILHGVTGFNLKSDDLACQDLHKDLHVDICHLAASLKKKSSIM